MRKSYKVYVSGYGFGGTAHWSSDDHRRTLCGRRFEGSHQRPDDARMCGNCAKIMAKDVAVAHVYAKADNTNWELDRAAAEAQAVEINGVPQISFEEALIEARAANAEAPKLKAGRRYKLTQTFTPEAPKAVTPTTARNISRFLRTKGFNPTYTAKRGSWSGLRVSTSADEVRVRVWGSSIGLEPSIEDRKTAQEIAELLIENGYAVRYTTGDYALYVRGREITP